VLEARRARHGAVWIGGELGLPASTVGRVLRRHRVPLLRDLDRLTGAPIRVRASGVRYERDRPGELIHVDVKKLGKIPDGGGWRVHGRSEAVRGRGIGYDYVHSAVDDHSRAAYSEVLPDEKGATCAGFLLRAGAWFTGHGVRVERVMTDNAMAYRHSGAWRDAMAVLGAQQVFTRPCRAPSPDVRVHPTSDRLELGCPPPVGKGGRAGPRGPGRRGSDRTVAADWVFRACRPGNGVLGRPPPAGLGEPWPTSSPSGWSLSAESLSRRR